MSTLAITKNPLRHCLLILFIFLVGGCATTPITPVNPEDRLAREARQLAQAGQHAQAAELYLTRANAAQGLERRRMQLAAAWHLLDSGDINRGRNLIESISLTGLPITEQIDLSLLRTRLALLEHQPQQALTLLSATPIATEGSDQAIRFHLLRAETYAMAGQHIESARERIWLEGLLRNAHERETNQQAIWADLSGLSESVLQGLLRQPPPDIFSGWVELVGVSRQLRMHGERADQALADWRARYPRHPAETYIVAHLRETTHMSGMQQIAVLLPLSGNLAGPANAIRDGILAARFQQVGQTEVPDIRFYDVGDGEDLVTLQYQQAITEGAQLVIGPLTKEAVQTLAESGPLQIPVLALNQVEGLYRDALYQFGLSPEDEARQVAERARWDGHQGAVALIPEGSWGDRVVLAFADHLQQLGGTLLEVQRYTQGQVDFSTVIQSLLNLDDSKRRQQALTRQLGRTLEFEPRRRGDADFVFLLAQSSEASQIMPQLRFHHAADLPVYTTSHANDGGLDGARSADVQGIRFCDMPWVLTPEEAMPPLHETLSALRPTEMKRYARLFALGIDAYQLIPSLSGARLPDMGYLHGVSGNLSIDPTLRILRELRWAEINDGSLQLLESATPLPEPRLPANYPQDTPDVPAMEIRDEYKKYRSPG